MCYFLQSSLYLCWVGVCLMVVIGDPAINELLEAL